MFSKKIKSLSLVMLAIITALTIGFGLANPFINKIDRVEAAATGEYLFGLVTASSGNTVTHFTSTTAAAAGTSTTYPSLEFATNASAPLLYKFSESDMTILGRTAGMYARTGNSGYTTRLTIPELTIGQKIIVFCGQNNNNSPSFSTLVTNAASTVKYNASGAFSSVSSGTPRAATTDEVSVGNAANLGKVAVIELTAVSNGSGIITTTGGRSVMFGFTISNAGGSEEPVEYTATYVYGTNGSGSPLSAETSGGKVTLPTPVANTGYTFSHWASTLGNSNGGAEVTLTENTTFTAVYTQNTYNVTYYNNGGTGSADYVANVTHGSSHSLVSIATAGFTAPSGKKFKEWNSQANGEGTTYGTAIANVTGAMSVYAVWEDITYTVSFANDSQGTPSGIDSIVVGAAVGVLDLPGAAGISVPSGYTFIGWTLNNNDILAAETQVTVDNDITYIAVYAKLVFLGTSFRKDLNPGMRFGFYIDYLNINGIDGSDLSGNFIVNTSKTTTIAIAGYDLTDGQYIFNNHGGGQYDGVFNLVITGFSAEFGEIELIIDAEVTLFGITISASSTDLYSGATTAKARAQAAYDSGMLTDEEAAMYGYNPN